MLAALEAAWVRWHARAALDVAGGTWRFAVSFAGLAMAAGAVFGLVQGLVVGAVRPLAEHLARPRTRYPHWAAVVYTVVLTPGVAWLCALGFSGRKARELPAHDLIVVGAALVLTLATYVGWRVVFELAARLELDAKRGEGQVRWAVAAAVALVAVGVGLYVADQRLLVRRYRFFHVALELMVFGAFELAVLAASLGARAGERRWARVAAPRGALAVALAALTLGAFGLGRFREVPTLRAVAHAYGAVAAALLDLARRLGFEPVPAAVAAVAPEPVGSSATPDVAVGAPRRPGADIFLITVDALRADHLGAYGYERPTSPALDALAAESFVFERAYAPVPHTSFSVASLLTGKYLASLARLGLADGHETLPEALRQYGWKTAAFFPPAIFFVEGERFRGYEERRFGFEYARYEPFPETEDAARRTDQVIEYLEAERPARVFVWVHYFGPHEPYVRQAGGVDFGERAVDLYDGEVRAVDAEIGRLLEHVRRTRPGAIVVLTSDHGEEFGEHGGAYHGTTLHDEQVRVPLLLHVPGEPTRRVRSPVSTVDVVPTVLALVDVPVSARVRGTDLGPWLGREPASEGRLPPVFAEVADERMVALGHEKLICDTARDYCRLYDLVDDPRERHDLSAARPERAAALRGHLVDWMTSHASYEREGGARDAATRARRAAIQRGELGDRDALPLLAEVVVDAEATAEERVAAARALARLAQAVRPGDAAWPEDVRSALAAPRRNEDDAQVRAWLTVALAAVGDREALADVRVLEAEDPELRARVAIARSDVEGLAVALERTSDLELRRAIVGALGRTRARPARAVLEGAYDDVMLRPHVPAALAALGDRGAVPFLAARLADEPYVGVRAALARALGELGDRRAVSALRSAFERDFEPQVVAACAWALARLGAAPTVKRGRVVARLRAPVNVVWLVPGDGQAEVTVDGRMVDTSASADAYPYALPTPTAHLDLRIGGPITHVVPRVR